MTSGVVFGKNEPLIERFGSAVAGCVSVVGATFGGSGVVDDAFDGITFLRPASSTGVRIDAKLEA
jgi:hypothetical protein